MTEDVRRVLLALDMASPPDAALRWAMALEAAGASEAERHAALLTMLLGIADAAERAYAEHRYRHALALTSSVMLVVRGMATDSGRDVADLRRDLFTNSLVGRALMCLSAAGDALRLRSAFGEQPTMVPVLRVLLSRGSHGV